MAPNFTGPERRRSPRLHSRVAVEVLWAGEDGSPVAQPGETEVFNAHGALLCTKPRFPVPPEVAVRCLGSGESARARLIGFREPDPQGRLRMMVELSAPNYSFWGIPVPQRAS